TVAERVAGGIDAAAERRVGDDTPLPDRAHQIVLADDPVAIADQVLQQVEHLRFDGKQFVAAMKLAPVAVEHKILEQVQQLGCLGSARKRPTTASVAPSSTQYQSPLNAKSMRPESRLKAWPAVPRILLAPAGGT